MNISKQKLLLMSIVIIMMILISNIFGFSSENFSVKSGITTSNVNLRKTTNLNSSSIIETIPKDTTVNIVGKIDNFYIVILRSGKVGLISKDYVLINEMTDNFVNYESIDNYYANISNDVVNLRGGASTSFQIYKKLYTGDKVQIIGSVNNFYLVITSDNYVGFIREDFINQSEAEKNNQDLVLKLINEERVKNGLNELKIDPMLQIVAQNKADDMVKENYFSHTSPNYGSPFEMMKNAGILYKKAGENIAGNPSIEMAVSNWFNSDTHKQNLLSKDYDYIGIGVTKSATYGYIIVAMFIQKV